MKSLAGLEAPGLRALGLRAPGCNRTVRAAARWRGAARKLIIKPSKLSLSFDLAWEWQFETSLFNNVLSIYCCIYLNCLKGKILLFKYLSIILT